MYKLFVLDRNIWYHVTVCLKKKQVNKKNSSRTTTQKI